MFKHIENKYRPIPFWSWNEKLDIAETKRQTALMEKAGMGGFFMHARNGLQTEYMGEEWFANVSAAVEEAKESGMYPWAYDENGFPSGFGDGKVNSIGVEFQQKFLRYENGEKETETTICNKDGYHFYYEVNPYYVDTLNKKATEQFIKEAYEPYYERYGNDIAGFFTDEPNASRNGIPWSFCIPEEYEAAYGENLLEHLIELYKPVGEYKRTRFQFWKLITNLFSRNYVKVLYDWCEEHGMKLTGHLLMEEKLQTQITTNGAVMAHYEYFHVPGMDWLGRQFSDSLAPLQVSSVAHQLGRKQVLSETYALCGHNMSFEDMKGLYEWQMVNGVTLLCQHLQGYSMRGIRKRDYPPAMFYQQPWWEEYKAFNDAMSRVGMILSEGRVEYDTLLIHPQSTAWIYFDNGRNEGIEDLEQSLVQTMECLQEKHILFHLGDESIMERHGRVEGDTLIIGCQRYKKVLLPKYEVLFESTKRLLEEFQKNGGVITTAEDMAENPVISSSHITYTKRSFADFDIHYFVNTTKQTCEAEISVGTKVLNIRTGEWKDFDGGHVFLPNDSLIVAANKAESITVRDKDTGQEEAFYRCRTKVNSEYKELSLEGEWAVRSAGWNSITLDKCDYYFDDELIERNGYVLNIQNRACALKRPVHIRCEYALKAEYIPEEMYLVCETPEIFDIRVNGIPVEKKDCGYFLDTAFRKMDIAKYLVTGTNQISLSVLFKQSERIYENLEKSYKDESERNKFTYDMEIEPVYIVGDFCVRTDGEFRSLERNAVRYSGGFVIVPPKKTLKLASIEQQGYPFFVGKLVLEKTFVLQDREDRKYRLALKKLGVNAVKIKVNDSLEKTFLWGPYEQDISEWLKKGENRIEITLINNLRNLLGPHHLEEGESYAVRPRNFFKEGCLWNSGIPAENWNEDYCFVETGLWEITECL